MSWVAAEVPETVPACARLSSHDELRAICDASLQGRILRGFARRWPLAMSESNLDIRAWPQRARRWRLLGHR